MDVREFEDCLDRWGEDLSLWPEPERGAAEALLSRSAEAQDLLAESVLMAEALSAPAIRAPAGLADRIVQQAIVQPVPKAVPLAVVVDKPTAWTRLAGVFPLPSRLSPAFVLPACFVIGIFVGFFSNPEQVDETHLDLPSYVAHVVDTAHDAD